MIKTFSQWLKIREDTGVDAGLPYGAQTTPPQNMATQPTNKPMTPNNLMGVPPHIVQQLQRTGPAMQNILNTANQSVKMGTHRDITAALQAALAEYNPNHTTNVIAHQAGQTAPSTQPSPVVGDQ